MAARGAPYCDSARMNPVAGGNFLTSAIPVTGDPFFGKSGRVNVQGSGSALGVSFDTTVPANLSGAVSVELDNFDTSMGSTGGTVVAIPQGYVHWDQYVVGLTNTAFEDIGCYCDSLDFLGAIGRPSIKAGQYQVGATFLQPDDPKKDPTGIYSAVSVEGSSPDIDNSIIDNTPPFRPVPYVSFSHYPDLIWTLRYADFQDPKTENWHVQLGSVFRDLSVEQPFANPNGSTFGWGLQLSGAIAIVNPCDFRDYVYFSATGGRGIGHYFNDLHLVTPIYDAVYPSTNPGADPELIPLMACYLGYTHQWSFHWRSTASFSYIGLTNPVPSSALMFHQGEEFSVNLVYELFHGESGFSYKIVGDDGYLHKVDVAKSQHVVLAGVEGIWGQRENFTGGVGSDNRVMLEIAVSK